MQFTALLLTAFVSAIATASPQSQHRSLINRANGTASATDFGGCSPAMSFAFGRAGRRATEGTFLPADQTVASGQQDALNPNIITNAICNNLINDCGLTKDSPGKTTCLAAKAVVAGLSTNDQTTANAFNNALGVSARV